MVRLRWRLLSFGALAVLIGACGGRPDPLLSISGPKDIVRFKLEDAQGQALWAIDSRQAQTLSFLYYGELPEGFDQRVPADGSRPRSLVDGEPLTAQTRSLTRVFVHYGHALGPASFRVAYSRMELIGPPKEMAEQ